jgi:hypothetical protein
MIIGALSCGVAVAPRAQTPRDTVTLAPHDPAPQRKRYVMPALQVGGFLALLNGVDRVLFPNEEVDGVKVFSSTPATTWKHLREQRWEIDKDAFDVNQFGHPYQGATMYGLVRSNGYGFWTSLVGSNLGSFAWEMAGETSQPSLNDLFTTGQAGSLLGEVLYRMADLVIRDDDESIPARRKEYSAALIFPPLGFNRRFFSDRFRARLPETWPANTWQLRFGASVGALKKTFDSPANTLRRDATADFSMSYGLPGQPGYKWEKPLDYFDVQFGLLANNTNPIEHVLLRGLLVGKEIAEGEKVRGIWGLYGSYDYIAPYQFRISNTALSIGTTRQRNYTENLALQSSVLAGVGWGAAGSPGGLPPAKVDDPHTRDYHAGPTPHALLAMRLIAGNRASVDFEGRQYYVIGGGSDEAPGSELVFRGSLGFTMRVVGGHAIGARLVAFKRSAEYGSQPDFTRSEGTISLTYSITGSGGVSAVKWQ